MIINCTPHPIKIYRKNGSCLELPKGEIVPRLTTQQTKVTEFEGIEFFKTDYGGLSNMPPVVDGVFYVVSRMVLDASPKSRQDLVAPGEAVRDDKGNIIGCNGLSI